MLELELLEIWVSSKLSDFKISINSSCFSFTFIYQIRRSRSVLTIFMRYCYFLIASIEGGTIQLMCYTLEFSFSISETSQYSRFFSASNYFSRFFNWLLYIYSYLLRSGFFQPHWYKLSSTLDNRLPQQSTYLAIFLFLSIIPSSIFDSFYLAIRSRSQTLMLFYLSIAYLVASTLICISILARISLCRYFSRSSNSSFFSSAFIFRELSYFSREIIFFFSFRLSSQTLITQVFSSCCFLSSQQFLLRSSNYFSFQAIDYLILASLVSLVPSALSIANETISLLLCIADSYSNNFLFSPLRTRKFSLSFSICCLTNVYSFTFWCVTSDL